MFFFVCEITKVFFTNTKTICWYMTNQTVGHHADINLLNLNKLII